MLRYNTFTEIRVTVYLKIEEPIDVDPARFSLRLQTLQHLCLSQRLINEAPQTKLALTSNGINLIKEDDAGFLRPSHFKKLPHHPGSLPYILLYQLRTNHSNKASISTICNSPSKQSFTSTGRAK